MQEENIVAKSATRTQSVDDRRGVPSHVDVLIVGAGLSGVGVASHLTTKQPGRTFAIVDARDAIGGTWDLFRYPGIRSDSDLHTFGYAFKPWTGKNSIADGREILEYIQETLDDYGLEPHIHLGHKVISANFSTQAGLWTVTLERTLDGALVELTCSWLFSAAGYFDYDGGYTPDFKGRNDFEGQVVHPQAWPDDLDYTGKNVVVIGSGATAVTLIPAMADCVGHITMLQRSPTYVVKIPKQDPIAQVVKKLLPPKLAYQVARTISANRIRLIYGASQRYPDAVRGLIRKATIKALPDGFDVDTHFKPEYGPWDQRMCTVPDGDLFESLSSGKASIVTDSIVRMTPRGILLKSGQELEADLVVTATGLNMVPYGKIEFSVDGENVDLHRTLVYKAAMLSGVPNFAFAFGYTNSSWTLKVDLVAEYLCRLLAHMDRGGYSVALPVDDDPTVIRSTFSNMDSGYFRRSAHLYPQQGSHGSWTMSQSYAADRARLRDGDLDDPSLHLSSPVGEIAPSLKQVASV
ncbi:flavin-containing monooxygenase (plasmid) [Rhodococcus globerulus]|uniref:flavin-containing monooxygenase n=1 Tax=Rhodococcus globerulus TaxID=33008 RepID=UPI0039EA43C8